MNHIKKIILTSLMLSGMLLFIASCMKKEDFDFNRLSNSIEIEPTFVFPLLNAELDFEDVVALTNSESTEAFISYADDVVVLNYMDTVRVAFPLENPFFKNSAPIPIRLPVEGSVEIPFLSQNQSESFKFLAANAVFNAAARANANIGSCVMHDLKLYFINSAGTASEFVVGDVTFNTQSGLFNEVLTLDITEEFFKTLPTKVSYAFELEIDITDIQLPLPEELVLDLAVDVDFPIHGYFGGISFDYDTELNMDFGAMPDINQLDIALTFKNNFPFDLTCQVYLLDENRVAIDSLFDSRETITAPPIQNEISVGFAEETAVIDYGAERAEKLKAVKYAVVATTFNSADIEHEQMVKVLRTNKLAIRAIVTISEDINTNELL